MSEYIGRFALCCALLLSVSSGAQEEPTAPDSIKGGPSVLIELDGDRYHLDKFEVTNAEYALFLNERGNKEEEGAYWVELRSRFVLIEENEGVFAAKDSFETHPSSRFLGTEPVPTASGRGNGCQRSANGATPVRGQKG